MINPWIIIAFLLALAGFYGYGHHKGWVERDAEMQAEIAQKNEEARTKEQELAKQIVDQFVDFSFSRTGRKRALTDYVMAFWFAELALRATKRTTKAYRAPNSPYAVSNPYFERNKIRLRTPQTLVRR